MATQLEAVNTLLTTVGLSPVDAVNESDSTQRIALDILNAQVRLLCSRAWSFNIRHWDRLTPDGSKHITPSTTYGEPLWVSVGNVPYASLVNGKIVRLDSAEGDNTLWDEDALDVDVAVAVPLEQLPQHAFVLVVARSARIFHDRINGGDSQHQFTARDEREALVEFNRTETRIARSNVLKYASHIRR